MKSPIDHPASGGQIQSTRAVIRQLVTSHLFCAGARVLFMGSPVKESAYSLALSRLGAIEIPIRVPARKLK